jgi:glycosyltransferase involved in cell wall biosynthesis
MDDDPRTELAILGNPHAPAPADARGSARASHLAALGLVRSHRYAEIHLFPDAQSSNRGSFLNSGAKVATETRIWVRERAQLLTAHGHYHAIFVPEIETELCLPHAFRPVADWVPVVCEVGVSYSAAQLTHLFLASSTGLLRETDVLMFKSRPTAALFGRFFDHWSQFGVALTRPCTRVISQAIDISDNRRDDELRAATRDELGITETQVVFLVFSRLSRGTKGDHRSLLVAWRDVIATMPECVLILAGANVDARFTMELRTLARELDVDKRVIVLQNPYDLWSDAKARLMSTADVFLHLGVGPEEVAPLVVCEAMAHGLPVIAASWSGLQDLVSDGVTGFLVPTVYAPVPMSMQLANPLNLDPQYNIELAQSVACDYAEIVRTCVTLAGSAPSRRRLGAAAHERATSQLSIEAATAQRLECFDEAASMAAARFGESPVTLRPFIDVNLISACLGDRPIQPVDRLWPADLRNMDWMAESRTPGGRAVLQALRKAIQEQPGATVQAVVASAYGEILGPTDTADTEIDDESAALWLRLVVRGAASGGIRIETNRRDQPALQPMRTLRQE